MKYFNPKKEKQVLAQHNISDEKKIRHHTGRKLN
jgi:hypothetical protein